MRLEDGTRKQEYQLQDNRQYIIHVNKSTDIDLKQKGGEM